MKLKIYNLKTKKIEEEVVCAGSFLNFLYSNFLGNVLIWGIFKRAIFSRLCGIWANSKSSRKAIKKFIEENNINTDEMLYDFKNFKTFNEFFHRALREDARPICNQTNDNTLSFPSDGRHLCFENISANNAFYAKNQKFDLNKFLASETLAKRFQGGAMLISRLSPLDYHRFHYPVSGKLVARKLLNGKLFSVSPIALCKNLKILWENKRVLNLIETKDFGLCAFVEIGATNVGTIVNFDELDSDVQRGKPAGLFKFGGSCVITLLEKNPNLKFDETLIENSKNSLESYAKVGEFLGEIVPKM